MTQKKLTAKRYKDQLADLQTLFTAALESGNHKLGLEIKKQMQDLDLLYFGPVSSSDVPDVFTTQRLAVDYLKALGFKINTTTFGAHVKDRHLVIKGEHGFARKALEDYAGRYLDQDIPLEEKESSQGAARLKERLENDLLQMKVDEKRGMLKPIAVIEEQWLGRYSLFEDAFKNMVHGEARRWVILVGGDEERTGNLVDEVLVAVDIALNHLSQAGEVDVTFDEETA